VPVPIYKSFYGQICPLEALTITADKDGIISKYYFKNGQVVKKGELIANVNYYSLNYEYLLSKSDARSLTDKLEYLKTMHANGLIGDYEIKQIEIDIKKFENVSQIYNKKEIYAPANGMFFLNENDDVIKNKLYQGGIIGKIVTSPKTFVRVVISKKYSRFITIGTNAKIATDYQGIYINWINGNITSKVVVAEKDEIILNISTDENKLYKKLWDNTRVEIPIVNESLVEMFLRGNRENNTVINKISENLHIYRYSVSAYIKKYFDK
jgi:hypothetical protein